MIVDKRVYSLKPGGVPVYMKIYEEFGLKPQTRHLGQPIGWYFSEVGTLNQITHIWGYDDLADRTARRAATPEAKRPSAMPIPTSPTNSASTSARWSAYGPSPPK